MLSDDNVMKMSKWRTRKINLEGRKNKDNKVIEA